MYPKCMHVCIGCKVARVCVRAHEKERERRERGEAESEIGRGGKERERESMVMCHAWVHDMYVNMCSDGECVCKVCVLDVG